MASEFVSKAVLLLHSEAEDSAEQLRALVDECHKQAPQAPQAPQAAQVPAAPSKIKASVNLAPVPIAPSTSQPPITTANIVECQECHKSGPTDQNISDPRFVWYCSQCQNDQKKVKLMSKSKVAANTSSSSSSSTSTKDQASTSSSTNSSVGPFRSSMSNTKGKSGDTNAPKDTKLAGLSAFAANLNRNKNKG